MHPRFTISDLFGLTLVVATVGCRQSQKPGDPLPQLADIESMTADVYQESPNNVKFVVPQSHWQSVFDALRPARLDENPAKWVWLGELIVIRKEGRPFKIFLFDVSDGAGAFAAGQSWESRRYYRGGDSAKLKKTLDRAQSD